MRWSRVEGVVDYSVIRGLLINIQETQDAIDLGEVVCIESKSLDESTEMREDAKVPAVGEAFFYLVEYNDGANSSYGTESASKPRILALGSCQ